MVQWSMPRRESQQNTRVSAILPHIPIFALSRRRHPSKLGRRLINVSGDPAGLNRQRVSLAVQRFDCFQGPSQSMPNYSLSTLETIVANFGDSRRQSPNSATIVASVDRALGYSATFVDCVMFCFTPEISLPRSVCIYNSKPPLVRVST